MNYDETALNLINEWENGEYLNDCQKKAKLQCLIVDALKGAAFSDSGPTAVSIPHSAIDLIRSCTTFSITETSNMDRAMVEDIVSSIKARADKAFADFESND